MPVVLLSTLKDDSKVMLVLLRKVVTRESRPLLVIVPLVKLVAFS